MGFFLWVPTLSIATGTTKINNVTSEIILPAVLSGQQLEVFGELY